MGRVVLGAGTDRFGRDRKILAGRTVDIKVANEDTAGGLFIMESCDFTPGGPPRHLHHDQEEWFYVVAGSYVIEIGDERFELGPGDSVLAPRKVPHVWAFTGGAPGRILIGFQPAGRMQEFFEELAKIEGVPDNPTMVRLFAEHGMEVLGPPLIH